MLNDTRTKEERPGDCLSSDIYLSASHQITALNQQAEKRQVAHHHGAITPAGLVPLQQPEQRGGGRGGCCPIPRDQQPPTLGNSFRFPLLRMVKRVRLGPPPSCARR